MHPSILDIVFWACLALGGVYTLFTLFMGGLSHAVGHLPHLPHPGHSLHLPHAPHTHGTHGAHPSASHPAHSDPNAHAQHRADHRAELEKRVSSFNVLAYLNPMTIAGFLLGFGGVGTTCRLLGMKIAPSLIAASMGGWAVWLSAYLVISRVFGAAGGSSHNRQEDLVGMHARVTTSIEGTQPGRVVYTVSGARQSLRAITDEQETIPIGATVRIRRVESGTAYVSRIDG